MGPVLASGRVLTDNTGIWLGNEGELHITELKDLVPCYSNLEIVHFETRPACLSTGQLEQLLLTGNSDELPVLRIPRRAISSRHSPFTKH